MNSRGYLTGALAALAVLITLGVLAKTSAMTSADIGLDERLAAIRSGFLTTLAKLATVAASSTVGVAATVLVPVALWFTGRRRDAVHALGFLGGAIAIAFVVKHAISEHRPPQALWVIPPDNAQSFPSGHVTVATALVLTAVLLAPEHRRSLVAVLGEVFIAWVAFARMYLGVHYLPDVLGGVLAAVTAAALVTGVLRLSSVRTRLDTLEPGPEDPPHGRAEVKTLSGSSPR